MTSIPLIIFIVARVRKSKAATCYKNDEVETKGCQHSAPDIAWETPLWSCDEEFPEKISILDPSGEAVDTSKNPLK